MEPKSNASHAKPIILNFSKVKVKRKSKIQIIIMVKYEGYYLYFTN